MRYLADHPESVEFRYEVHGKASRKAAASSLAMSSAPLSAHAATALNVAPPNAPQTPLHRDIAPSQGLLMSPLTPLSQSLSMHNPDFDLLLMT